MSYRYFEAADQFELFKEPPGMQKRPLSNGTIPPLNHPLPNMPAPPPEMVSGTEWQSRHDHVTHVTTLENGIKVASEDSFGQFSTVGGKLNL